MLKKNSPKNIIRNAPERKVVVFFLAHRSQVEAAGGGPFVIEVLGQGCPPLPEVVSILILLLLIVTPMPPDTTEGTAG